MAKGKQDYDFRNVLREVTFRLSHENKTENDAMIYGSRKADINRAVLPFFQYAKQKNSISHYCFQDIAHYYMNEYARIVDDFEGLNNYSDEAVQFAKDKGFVNESRKWQSSLKNASSEDIQKLFPVNLEHIQDPLEKEFNLLLDTYRNTNLSFLLTNDEDLHQSITSHATHHKGEPVKMHTKNNYPELLVETNSCESFKQNRIKPESFNCTNKLSAQTEEAVLKPPINIKRYPRYFETPKNLDLQSRRIITTGGTNNVEVCSFKTAKEKLISDDFQKQGGTASSYGSNRKSLGSRRTVGSGFVPPIVNRVLESNEPKTSLDKGNDVIDERLKNIDPKMIELMNNEIMDNGSPVTWNDIAGLEFAKNTIQEIVVWPLLRPDLFTGLRGPPKGILLFGPPGTGKTLIGKCIASQSKSTFFCISASSLTSKWVGEGEKLVRALFAVARCHQPAVIFIDEIDSLLTHRSDNEHESSRRIKTEFLVQLDGASTATDERLLIVGATNRPQELDEAARRRLVKRLYIPLPEAPARLEIVQKLLNDQKQSLTQDQLQVICNHTEGYSGADMANLCKEAALGPMRDITFADIENVKLDQVRPINLQDFLKAVKQVRASVSDKDLELYEEWNNKYGSGNY